MSPLSPSAELSDRHHEVHHISGIKMTEMWFLSISLLLEPLQSLIANEKRSECNGARSKDLAVVLMLDFLLFCLKANWNQDVIRHWQIPFCPTENIIFLLNTFLEFYLQQKIFCIWIRKVTTFGSGDTACTTVAFRWRWSFTVYCSVLLSVRLNFYT